MDQPYRWHRLVDEAADSIRLLCLYHDNDQDQISAELLECRMSAQPDYIVLPHTSGWSEPSERLYIGDGGEEGYLCINPDEASMLRTLRDKAADSDGPAFWMASICINPSDAKEKIAQAARTTKILRNATTILKWEESGVEGEPPSLTQAQTPFDIKERLEAGNADESGHDGR